MKSLFAAEERESKLSKLGDPLESLGQHVDFAALAASVDRALPRPHRYLSGRPPYPTELMIHPLVIQQLFNLSDAQLEFQVLDRASFQHFLGRLLGNFASLVLSSLSLGVQSDLIRH